MSICIAVIPARGGSKRIARKNVRDFCGSPMISFAISAAIRSGLFEHVIVSTDDAEIAEVSRSWKAEIPFLRPPHLADDFTGTIPVVAHAIEECQHSGWTFDTVCCIYPAVPMIQDGDLVNALALLDADRVDYSFPITEFPHPIQRALRRDAAGRTSPFYPEYERVRSQDLEKAYHDAGQFYWGRSTAWLEHKPIHSNGVGMVIPHWRVVDIDTPDDWARAELLYRALQS
jgi:pseudaminic acid cytidylyltransferase